MIVKFSYTNQVRGLPYQELFYFCAPGTYLNSTVVFQNNNVVNFMLLHLCVCVAKWYGSERGIQQLNAKTAELLPFEK